ncbi:MAG: TetR/AcrR family transcriptional regulator [Actinomycetota bacterium]
MSSATVVHPRIVAASSTNRVKLIDAALACITRSGTRKITVDDIANEVPCSRATVYRTFPGGRDAIFGAAVETEIARFYSTLAIPMGRSNDLSELVVSTITVAAAYLLNHQTLQYLRDNEPEVVMTHLRFGEMDGALLSASAFAQPFFARWMEPEAAGRAAELVVRTLVSYLLDPVPSFSLENEEQVGKFAAQFLLPAMVVPDGPPAKKSRSRSTPQLAKKGRSTS